MCADKIRVPVAAIAAIAAMVSVGKPKGVAPQKFRHCRGPQIIANQKKN
jgi:hypothetical protein